eukprot:UN2588
MQCCAVPCCTARSTLTAFGRSRIMIHEKRSMATVCSARSPRPRAQLRACMIFLRCAASQYSAL